ncbi:MAG: aldo/keto reductase, partial [Pseudomonadales bacterium]|nr:aldo/keto reductase [Pseudomonadales bacterium]
MTMSPRLRVIRFCRVRRFQFEQRLLRSVRQIGQRSLVGFMGETLFASSEMNIAFEFGHLRAEARAAYRTEHLERFVALQAQYSLVVRDLEREHTPVCERYGLGILPWSPLAGGFLSGK